MLIVNIVAGIITMCDFTNTVLVRNSFYWREKCDCNKNNLIMECCVYTEDIYELTW